MYRRIIPFLPLMLGLAWALFSCNSNRKEKEADETAGPISVSQLSAPFAQSFDQLLQSYFELKDAFVEADTVKANAAAASLLLNTQNLKIAELQDTSGTIRETAQVFASTISGSAQALVGEQNIDDKRRELSMISDALWNLIRTVRYEDTKLYYQYCPMAFDNAGAYWISQSSDVKNPYFGEKMVTCGEAIDSLDYGKQ
jgi:hypothetical protein